MLINYCSILLIKSLKNRSFRIYGLLIILVLLSNHLSYSQKKTSFSVSVEPLISWFSNDNQNIDTKGSKIGIAYGITLDRFFDEKYAITSGFFMTYFGGFLNYGDTVNIKTSIDTVMIPAGTRMSYNLHYLKIPLGLKFKTVDIGYKIFYFEVGMNALIRLNSKASTDNNLLHRDKIRDETRFFNLAYFVGAGLEYSLGGTTSLIGGIYYSNSLLDITTDILNKPNDHLRSNQIALKLGVLF